MALSWIVSKGDTGKPLEATLRDKLGVADLTGCTVTAYMTPEGDFDTKTINGASVTVVSATAGTVRYNPAAGDFATAGKYCFQFVVTNGAGKQTTFPTDYGEAGYISVTVVAGAND